MTSEFVAWILQWRCHIYRFKNNKSGATAEKCRGMCKWWPGQHAQKDVPTWIRTRQIFFSSTHCKTWRGHNYGRGINASHWSRRLLSILALHDVDSSERVLLLSSKKFSSILLMLNIMSSLRLRFAWNCCRALGGTCNTTQDHAALKPRCSKTLQCGALHSACLRRGHAPKTPRFVFRVHCPCKL